MLEGFGAGIILALFLNCLVLYALTILFPSNGNLRQYIVIFVAESLLGYQDMRDDVMAVVMHHTAKRERNIKKEFNGLLDNYFSQLQRA